MIDIESLDVRFGEFHAVRDASFRVGAGEAFGLVGESGSGKTTVLKAIAGLLRGWRGRITVDGETLGEHRSRSFCQKVQMIFQDPYGSLHPRHTVDRTLAEPVLIHGLGGVSRGSSVRSARSASTPAFATAFRTSSRAASASGWRSRAR